MTETMDKELFKLWKRHARCYQQSCCNSLGDRLFDRVSDVELAFKVGYALYNAPSEVDENGKTGTYTKSQKSHIKQICDKLKALQENEENIYYVSCLYVVIRLRNKKKDDGVQVLFRVPTFVEGKPDLDSHIFVDPKPRVYNSWALYLKKNKLPKCDMCYPTNGVYTVIDGSIDIQFGASPACDVSTAVFTGLDVSSTLLLVGATGVTLASLAVPLSTPIVIGATAAVFTTGTYETARTIYRLHDIKSHGESLGLKNPDSRSAWLGLAGSVVGMASIGTTAVAKSVVATESVISRAGLLTLRVLNVSSLAVSSVGVINGVITLVMKRINGTLEILDIVQFTSTCLFFLNAIVSFEMASRLIEELALSELTNLFNLRQNSSFRIAKDIMDLQDSSMYSVLRQLVIGVNNYFCPDVKIEDLETLVFTVVTLLASLKGGKISRSKFFSEIYYIFSKIWNRYEKVLTSVIEEIKTTFETPYWQIVVPKEAATNLEVPRLMCVEIDRVIEHCGVTSHSAEHKNLLAFARAFSVHRAYSYRAFSHYVPPEKEFLNRFKFYCDCIVAQFNEERESYENELDSKSSEKEFDRSSFDKSYGIKVNKNVFFFVNAMDKVNHPDFLGNIDELYFALKSTDKSLNNLPYLQTTKSFIYTLCGPLNANKLSEDYYWTTASSLSGYEVNKCNSTMTMEVNKQRNLVLITPRKSECTYNENTDNKLSELEAILIQTSYINDCHMGLLFVILK